MVIFHSYVEFPEGDHLRAQASASAGASTGNAAVGVLQGHWAESSTWRSQGRDLEVTPTRKTPKNDGEPFFSGGIMGMRQWMIFEFGDYWMMLPWKLMAKMIWDVSVIMWVSLCECPYVVFFGGEEGVTGDISTPCVFFLLWGSAWQLLH